MLAPLTHISPLVNLRRSRMLSSKGRVLVRINQKLSATDIIAECKAESKHILIDIYQVLGVDSSRKSKQWISRKVGDKLQKGDILAQSGGIFKRVIRAPADCQIVTLGGGQIMLEMAGDTLSLQAGISGCVTEVIPDRGAIIEGNGVLIQGVWGNDHINMGLLQLAPSAADEELTCGRLDSGMQGAVVVFGHCSNPDALVEACDMKIRGLILGSINSELVAVARKMAVPIILTDGFGHLPINQVAYKILLTNDRREVSLNAASWNRFSGERPEIFIPLPVIGDPPSDVEEFAPGQIVRIQGTAPSGRIGEIIELHAEPQIINSGSRAPAAKINFGGQEILVPLANLEVIG
jgi:preprotein translocase subunit YajC